MDEYWKNLIRLRSSGLDNFVLFEWFRVRCYCPSWRNVRYCQKNCHPSFKRFKRNLRKESLYCQYRDLRRKINHWTKNVTKYYCKDRFTLGSWIRISRNWNHFQSYRRPFDHQRHDPWTENHGYLRILWHKKLYWCYVDPRGWCHAFCKLNCSDLSQSHLWSSRKP